MRREDKRRMKGGWIGKEYLDIAPGSVSVPGLMNDTKNQVRLLVDEDILKAEYFGCHPCVNTSSLRLKVSDVFGKFLKAVHHDYTVVTPGRPADTCDFDACHEV